MPLWPGSRTLTLIPSCANSIGGAPYSLANQHAAPLVSEENHSASRTLTTNQPSVTGASPEPASASLASFTQQILAVQTTGVSYGPACSYLTAPVRSSDSVERVRFRQSECVGLVRTIGARLLARRSGRPPKPLLQLPGCA